MKYTVKDALCPLYKEPSAESEYADEAFFGQGCEILERGGGFCRVHTDYDYEGWAPESCLTDAPYAPTHVVTSAFGDLLWEPKNCRFCALAVPRGSLLKIRGDGGTERYAAAETPDGGVYYIHSLNVVPAEELRYGMPESERRRRITDTARLYLGTGYRWGGKTAAGIDCSGLAFMSYFMSGLKVYRDADVSRSPALRLIELSEAKEGDLLFFEGHVAVYIGGGLFIHSTTALGGVGCNSLDPKSPLYREELAKTLKAVATAF